MTGVNSTTSPSDLGVPEVVPAFLAAVGTLAPRELATRFRDHLDARDIECRHYSRYSSMEELSGATGWRLAMVLSPFKQDAMRYCDGTSGEAAAIGVVDTLVRTRDGRLLGVNTNVRALYEAICSILAHSSAERVLILGSGSTARCSGHVFATRFPQIASYVWARSIERRNVLADLFRLRAVDTIGPVDGHRWDLVINCTTVGETGDGDGLPLADALSRGTRYLDLNNRVSELQVQALAAGAMVMSGAFMQDSVHRLRASLLLPRHHS